MENKCERWGFGGGGGRWWWRWVGTWAAFAAKCRRTHTPNHASAERTKRVGGNETENVDNTLIERRGDDSSSSSSSSSLDLKFLKRRGERGRTPHVCRGLGWARLRLLVFFINVGASRDLKDNSGL